MSRFTAEHLDQAKLFRYESITGAVYLGYADLGVADNEPKWSIKKVNTSDGSILWAEGSPAFNKTWTSRASYTYS